MQKKYIIGNWKCHKTSSEGRQWFDSFSSLYRSDPGLEVVIAPTSLSLEALAEYTAALKLENFSLAAQDVSPFPRGGYTGAVSADMIKKFARYVIVGHSERRRYFHESVSDVVNKVTEAADSGLTPIVCVEDINLLSRLAPIADIECEQLVVAYTPVDAVNFNIAESPAKVAEMVARIRQYFSGWPIIYGGSVVVANSADYLALEGLDGLFVGGGSLDAATFAKICRLPGLG